MIRSGNPVEYVLSQPMEFPPGNVWKYNGGTTQLLAAIIQKTTGKKVDEFAREYLFQPLGISRFEWAKYPGTDLPAAASGLRLRSRDLLKFGLLYSNGGYGTANKWSPKNGSTNQFNHMCNGRVALTDTNSGLARHIIESSDFYCGLCWQWRSTNFLDKTRELVVVLTAGNYNKWNIKNNAGALVKNYIYPALIKN
jgi:CubicO group peptidase (beta-lactamase class C family)